MRKTLEDFYYGNIVPCERQMAHGSELKKATDRIAKYESQLTEQLDEPEQIILANMKGTCWQTRSKPIGSICGSFRSLRKGSGQTGTC